ncbi:MAG: PAS domain-containing protein [Haloferacaceae archaeon]
MTDDGATDGRGRASDPELYRKLVEDTTDVATIVDPDGTIPFVSPAVERVLG